MEQQPHTLVSAQEVLPATGTKYMCAQCLTPQQPATPDQRARRGEACHVKVIVPSFLTESQGREIKVSEVLGQFERGGERRKMTRLETKTDPSSCTPQCTPGVTVQAWPGLAWQRLGGRKPEASLNYTARWGQPGLLETLSQKQNENEKSASRHFALLLVVCEPQG